MVFLKDFTVISIFTGIVGWLASPSNITDDPKTKFPIPPHTNKSLFYIQRSPNSNTVIYEANVLPNMTINNEDPVSVYWIRYAEMGQKKKLNYIERVLGYGVTCKANKDDSFTLHFNASESKKVLVRVDAHGQAHAEMTISKQKSKLEKIFVSVTERDWLLPKVNYVEFFGTDTASGEKTYEKMNI